MSDLLSQIQQHKTEAKNLRDLGPEFYGEAIDEANAAVELAERGLAGSTVVDERRDFAREAADCLGIIGGIERRWADVADDVARHGEHLIKSCDAYDRGTEYEWSDEFDIRNTYNLVNRLVSRLLIDRTALASDTESAFGIRPARPMNLRRELAKAQAQVEQHLARQGNYWAEADLALLKVLLGERDAAVAYSPFLALSPPGFAFSSALVALRPLAKTPIDGAPALSDAVALLEARKP